MTIENLTGHSLGQYLLRELLGRGGMGAVYRSYQANLKREVAVKVLDPQLAQQPGYAERFNLEAETAARLEHHHIIPVYDYGTQDGLSYVVMRLLTGGTLTQRMAASASAGQSQPSLSDVVDVLKQLASALDYAHSAGVIHRDIKPSNVMFDNHGQAYLVDFGIAKLTQASQALTVSGALMGTPLFMAPEQWRSEEPTPAMDQYALGVMTYLLVTGQLPFEADTPYSLMHKHLNEMPTPPQVLRKDLPDDVGTVLSRAMAKQADERFPTVTAFAQALEGAAAGSVDDRTNFFTAPIRKTKPPELPPVGLTPGAQGGPAPKPLIRRPLAWILGGLTLVAVVVGAAVLALSFSLGLLSGGPKVASMANTLSPQPSNAEGSLGGAAPSGAPSEQPAPTAGPATSPPLAAAPTAAPAPTLPPLPAIAVANASEVALANQLSVFGSPVGIAISPDGRTLAIATNFNILIYDLADLQTPIYELEGHQTLDSCVFSPDGTILASAGSSFDDTIRLWDIAHGGIELAVFTGHTEAIYGLAYSPDGTRLASGSRDDSVRMWDAKTGQELFFSLDHNAWVNAVAFSPDGAILASGGDDGKVRLWDVETGQALDVLDTGSYSVSALVFSPDGSLLASAGKYDDGIQLWDTGTRQMTIVLHGHTGGPALGGVYSLAFSPDGTILASGGGDKSIRLWNANRTSTGFGQELVTLLRHSDWVDGLTFSPDGSTLFSSSERDGTVRLWNIGGAALPQPAKP